MLTIFPAVMSIDLYRRQKKRVDVFCCIKINKDKIQPTKANGFLLNRSVSNQEPPPTAGDPPPPYDYSRQNGEAKEGKVDAEGKHSCSDLFGFTHLTLHHFVKHVYTPVLKITAVKVSYSQVYKSIP